MNRRTRFPVPASVRLSLAALLVAAIPALQGCFPIAAVGMTAGAVFASDRRGIAGQAVDQEIEHRASGRFRNELDARSHVNVVSYNRVILLTGEVPTAAEKAKVEAIAREMPFSPTVVNELQVREASSLLARSDDALLTSAVKTRLARGDVVSPTHVKVISEASVVYLLGLLTEREARSALEIASKTANVVKVVNVIQLINDPPKAEVAPKPQSTPATAPLPPTPPPVSPLQRPQRL